MSADESRKIPKEGSNHIEHKNDQKRSNVSEAMSVQHRDEPLDQPSQHKDEPFSDVERAEADNA